MTEIWPVVHAERQALAQDLEHLPAPQWATPSLCPGWDVHDVLAHLVDDARTTRLGFLCRLAAAGFDFDRCNARGIARERRADPRATLAAFRAVSGRTTSAPAPPATRLIEAIVHGEDIRRPLGISRIYPVGPVTEALRHQLRTGVRFGGGKERAHGLRVVTTDAGLETGTGPEVRGTAAALLLAVSGRAVGPEELAGPGAAALVR
ncbi:maleylpyruvate isomerase family mycothiol-dependent enzyme [Kocuria sp. SM24M-10]|uniref:maleylpyruvate isomerase family mycothiol-dependent enzyme n=1 Tax=Kocuria sp. SM24M-10 TaxID=1660349 RepID=UPI00064A5F5F|nr:maleylpyruvate isomerase family mycothiol-dependent enzyme [Kocuria sp. SM24M-10]KLU09409.1 actinobacterial protein [Kocuria sp. SM24M-10]